MKDTETSGEGFPDGLKENEIPLGSRIISIADKYDGLTNDVSKEMALEEIRALKGIQFDPSLHYQLEKVLKEGRIMASPPDLGVEKELEPHQLVVGMILLREVRSGTGILLLSKGVTLDVEKINFVKRYFNFDPPERRSVCGPKRSSPGPSE